MLITFSFHFIPYPLLMAIFYFFQVFLLSQIELDFWSFTIPLINCVILLLAILPDLKYQRFIRRTVDLNLQEEQKNNKINIANQFIQVKLIVKSNKKKILVVIAGILNFISNFLFFKASIIQSYNMAGLQFLFEVVFTGGLCYAIFKRKLYRHHYFALGIVVVATIAYYWGFSEYFEFYVKTLFQGSFGWFIFNQCLYGCLLAFQEVIEYYLMRTHYMSPYLILTIEGAISLVLNLIYFGFVQLMPVMPDESLFYFLNSAKKEVIASEFQKIFNQYSYSIGIVLGYVVFGVFTQIFRIQTNKRLTPIHRNIVENVYGLFFVIHDMIAYPHRISLTTFLRGCYCICLVVAFLVFNEHIMIHLCELDRNTFKQIDKRSSEEQNEDLRDFEPIEMAES